MDVGRGFRIGSVRQGHFCESGDRRGRTRVRRGACHGRSWPDSVAGAKGQGGRKLVGHGGRIHPDWGPDGDSEVPDCRFPRRPVRCWLRRQAHRTGRPGSSPSLAGSPKPGRRTDMVHNRYVFAWLGHSSDRHLEHIGGSGRRRIRPRGRSGTERALACAEGGEGRLRELHVADCGCLCAARTRRLGSGASCGGARLGSGRTGKPLRCWTKLQPCGRWQKPSLDGSSVIEPRRRLGRCGHVPTRVWIVRHRPCRGGWSEGSVRRRSSRGQESRLALDCASQRHGRRRQLVGLRRLSGARDGRIQVPLQRRSGRRLVRNANHPPQVSARIGHSRRWTHGHRRRHDDRRCSLRCGPHARIRPRFQSGFNAAAMTVWWNNSHLPPGRACRGECPRKLGGDGDAGARGGERKMWSEARLASLQSRAPCAPPR